ncbi:hypothetical protein Poli38472_002389 [Pythium oligandrum]|uniref:WD repeat-containing protein 27 n=1 Tax=Pythium oligandrum TaxID=41045 RepID=A0A8K1FM97_PYTOL|nr:hypothetical protein Poli38472_002389 [Pythium oligandrum]|eukprot:TMW63448.1 hypothetical protein Poli38472_002389 [Pythium oligandrum]
MELLEELSWQWRPDAAITAVDSTQRCTAIALQYPDCAVVRVRPSEWPPVRHQSRKRKEPEVASKDIELHGHFDRVCCLRWHACVDTLDLLLVSASSDRVLVWHLDASLNASKTVMVEKLPAEPSCVAFDHTGTLLAVACERDVEVRIIHSREIFVTLEGHIARVTKCEFHPLRHHLLFTCSEDRTFKIWDLAAKALLFQSAVLSAFPILSLALNPVTGDACLGFGDGSLKIFTVHENFAREHATLNVETFMRRQLRRRQRQDDIQEVLRESPNVISALPPWARSERAQETAQIQAIVTGASSVRKNYSDVSDRRRPIVLPSEENAIEIACPVLGMRYLCVDVLNGGRDHDSTPAFNAHGEQELLDREQFILVAVPSHLLSINAFSYEIAVLKDFQTPFSTFDAVAVAKELSFHTAEGSDFMFCGVVSAFLPCFTMVSTSLRHDRTGDVEEEPTDMPPSSNQIAEDTDRRPKTASSSPFKRISMIATGPPPPESVLNLPPLSVRKPSPKPSKKAIQDKPITFRTRIKSSGYGTAPAFSATGTRRTSIAERRTSATATTIKVKTSVESFLKEYPMQCGLLQHFQPKHALPPKTLHQGAIHHIEYSADAKWLASSGNDKLAIASKLPFSRFQGEGNVLAGHDHAVRAIHWSHNNQMVLTTSSDKTTRLWLTDSDVASLTFHGTTPSPSSGSISSAKKALPHDVVDAMFFYMDKFVLSASGNAVRLHQFEIDELFARAQTKKAKKNDLLHEDNKSRKKKVAQWVFGEVQTLTSLTCVNGSFLSSMVIVAGSDRSLRIVDAAVGKTTRVIQEAHTRAAHSVVLPRASCFTSHPPNFYDLLLSSAPNSTIHLWDIRADNCVMRFGQHVNRVHRLGVAFSPCMRYVATGSEDRMTYLYDIRTGRCVTRLAGHTDAVTSVAFNPLYPQLATASYDGTVRFYSDVTT